MTEPERVDTVVIGSGFGGSAMACRLAEAGAEVCVLERGRPYPPGSFPRSPAGISRNFWDPSEGLYGMFNPWSFRHLEALVASGLGGGSLIYANVMLRKDERWFEEAAPPGWRWPVTYAELEPFYTKAEEALGATPYPFQREPYASTPRTRAMKEAAERLQENEPGARWQLPNLAVSFTPPDQDPALGVPIPEPAESRNLHGLPRYTCRLCGECDIGCNLGSKNTLDFTYLSAGERAGAQIRPLSEVRRLSRHEAGYLVEYDEHHPELDRPPSARRTRRQLSARRVVLAAGTLGTTYLLLRNRAALPHLSAALGTRFCGNGDFLSFARNCMDTDADGERKRALEPSRGPVITSAIRVPDQLDGPGAGAPPGARGFYIEDAGWPEFANWMVQVFDTPGVLWRAGNRARSAVRQYLERDPDSDLGAEVSELLGDGHLSNATLGMLGMGRDVPDGRLRLRGQGRLDVDWSSRSSREYFTRLSRTMERVAGLLGGSYLENPMWHWARRLITVHPLGGCPMGRDVSEGVVDAWGRVFGYEDLYVVDGSVMPGPVGANPSLTIAAFAERCADRIAREELGRGG